MKIGDKVKVTYSNGDQYVGRLTGETAKMWQITSDGAAKGEQRIRMAFKVADKYRENKTMQMELVDDPETLEKEVISVVPDIDTTLKAYKKSQDRNINWKLCLIIAGTLLIAAFAICVGLDVISIGQGGIQFHF